MDFENMNPNTPYPQVQEQGYFEKPIQNPYEQYQYTNNQYNQMNSGFSNPSNMNYCYPNQQTPFMPEFQNYNNMNNNQMSYPVYNHYETGYNNNNQQYNAQTTNLQGFPIQNQPYVANNQNNIMGVANKEDEEEKLDPDFKPEEVLEEESDDDGNEGFLLFLIYIMFFYF